MSEQELKKLEDKLWAAADKMRGAVSVSDYKFIVLGLIFLKYISDSFEEKYKELVEEGAGLEEERDCYTAENIFYVPKNARWEYLVEHSKDTNIGEIIDDALTLIEKENNSLKNVLPKNYNSPTMRNVNLGELLDLFTNIKVGTRKAKEKDLLGRIYEYFLGMFAKNELQKGGEFYTPSCLVKTMVECIEPFDGKVYDPACGSGGMFIQSMKFVNEHQGNPYNIGIYGQEKNPTTWRLAKMNLAIRSMYGNLGSYAADTFTEDLHKDLKTDFILANPPFNMEWEREKVENDPRWKYGFPPKGNANFAWIQHMVSKLKQNGKMACILANGSMSSDYDTEDDIRKKLIENDLVEAMIAMPTNLFYTVTVPCSIWIINRNKKRKDEVLFIDATSLGHMINRKIRELSNEDITKISDAYHRFSKDENYENIKGFCRCANIEEIAKNNYILTPGRYVENDTTDDEYDFDTEFNKMKDDFKNKLVVTLMKKVFNDMFTNDYGKVKLKSIVTKSNTGADAIKKAPIVDYDTGCRCIRIGDLTNNRNYDDWGFCLVDEVNFERYKLLKDDIVVGRTSAIGINKLILDNRKAVYNNGTIRITIDKEQASPKYVYMALNTNDYFNYINRIKNETSTRENMKLDYLLDYEILLPPIELQKKYEKIFDKVFNYIENDIFNYETIVNKINEIINE